jgi:2-methylcitrate dehydratase PrpD
LLAVAEPTLAEQIGAFAAGVTLEALPEVVLSGVRLRVLDILGICAAASGLDTSRAVYEFATDQGGVPQSSGVGLSVKVPAALAGLINGVLAHSLDYDDTHLPSVVHPSASVIPAALAVAESVGADGAATVAAIACGLETCVRLGMAGYDAESGSSLYFDRGQHATSICGALGGAVAAGVLMGFGPEELADALAVAASMGSGIIEANRTGGTVKRLHCGWAAHAAISAAQLVRHGFTGPRTVLEGRFGFFQAWLDGKFDAGAISDGLGERWLTADIVFKPYPANHFTHTAIDAAIAIRDRGVNPDDIDGVTLGVAEPTVRTIGEPIEVKRRPDTGYMAQFSGPYVVAAALLGGGGLGLGLGDFTDELARDRRRRALMAKVSVVADERCTAVFPHQFPSVLRVRLDDGSEIVEEVMVNRGGPARPLSPGDVSIKFEDNVRGRLPATTIRELEQLTGRIEDLHTVEELLRPLARGLTLADDNTEVH